MPEAPSRDTVRVAVVQPAASPFNLPAALEAVHQGVRDAAGQGAELILFPEAFLGGYPWGLRFGSTIGGRTEEGKGLYQRYWESAITIPGPHANALGAMAREAGAHLSVGLIERTPGRASTLYCTQATWGPDGALLGIHRKLKPTAIERLIWGEGDGSTLPVFDTPIGRVGGLICWENYMPLARMALYGKGVEIYLAPTADSRDRWQATLRHIAVEGRCFVLGCNQWVRKLHYPEDILGLPGVAQELAGWDDEMCPGGSVVYGPDGELLAGPLLHTSGVLVANLDLGHLARQRLEFDVVGHYNRPDLFHFTVDERPRASVHYRGGA
jgi:nitrilase